MLKITVLKKWECFITVFKKPKGIIIVFMELEGFRYNPSQG